MRIGFSGFHGMPMRFFSGENGSNIVARVVDQGATVAVGFVDSIECEKANKWVELVCYYLCQGQTVKEATDTVNGWIISTSIMKPEYR